MLHASTSQKASLLFLVVAASCIALVHGGAVHLFAVPVVAAAPAVLAAPAAVSHTYAHRVHAPLAAAYPVHYVVG
ncbi:uncharacterized protein LOC125939737 [Dermacentor silvarum]|uniref:uncharacterized protein LOC125939737 n=1 Tax=Dermacentor silvarum TaxID=543639 RepID=UPI0021012C5E|nr:uncharacterized protein LOC125939737 [Dermacentor silvarum]